MLGESAGLPASQPPSLPAWLGREELACEVVEAVTPVV